jgi:hypothetical protein
VPGNTITLGPDGTVTHAPTSSSDASKENRNIEVMILYAGFMMRVAESRAAIHLGIA